jgi:hypothetical protein
MGLVIWEPEAGSWIRIASSGRAGAAAVGVKVEVPSTVGPMSGVGVSVAIGAGEGVSVRTIVGVLTGVPGIGLPGWQAAIRSPIMSNRNTFLNFIQDSYSWKLLQTETEHLTREDNI